MEPLDPAKNDEGSGFTRRRISSILKAPQRSSMKFSDPVQQENVVECAKPVEKRNSRRVSFAPANNVLLFSKDGKNASPAKNPLQELIMTTAAATNNRVQVALTEDGIQPITGMETLLNAPLHASQQGHKVNFDTVGGLGEKTVMFSTNDEFMDMTHSHTINIAGDAELLGDISLQNYDPLPSRREKTAMFSVNNGSMARNVSSSVPSLDTEFENFLDSHSKQSSPSPSLVVTRTKHAPVAPSEEANRSLAQIKTQRADVDKENQAPTSVSAVMEKSLNPSKKIGELSYRSALCPEDDISMDMTEPEADCMLGFTDDDDDPFQCLFPTQEMYSRFDNRVLQTAEKTKQQKSSKTLASFNPKDMTSLKNPAVHASHRRHKANCDTENDCKEKTIMFSAGDEFMNMTQSHTVNIASSLLPPPNQNLDIVHTLGKMDNASSLEERKHEAGGAPGLSANAMDLGFEDFLSSLSKPGASSGNPAIARAIPSAAASSKETVDINSSLFQLRSNVCKVSQSLITSRSVEKSFNGSTISPENDVSTYMTKVQTDRIIGPTASDDPFRCHFPTQEMYSRCEGLKKQEMTSGQKNSEALGSSNCAGMETALKPSLKTKVERNPVKFDTEDDCREKPERFSATDAAMDVTQSHTVNIATGFELQSFQNVDRLAISGEKTFKFTANNTSMDMTRSHTVNIATDLKLLSQQNVDSLPACGEKTMRFNTTDAAMDVTRSHTVNIATDLKLLSQQNVDSLPACGEKTMRFNTTDAAMDVTRSHTVNIATHLKPQSQQNVDSLPARGERTMRFNTTDAAMDVTRSHTVNIATDLKPQSQQDEVILPADEKTTRFTDNDAAMDVTQCLAGNIDSNSVSESLLYHDSNILFTHKDADFPLSAQKTDHPRHQSLSAHTLDPGFKNSLCKMSDPWARAVAPAALSPQETEDTDNLLDQFKTQKPVVDTEKVALGFVSAVLERPANKTMTESPEDDMSVSMNMTEAQTGGILGQTYTGELPQCLSSSQDMYPNPDLLKKTEATPQQRNEALGSSNPGGVEIPNLPDSPDSNETGTSKEPKSKNLSCTLSQKMVSSPCAVDHDIDTAPSQKSRRMSLADLKSKVRRLSHMVSTAPDTIAMDSRTAPLPHLERDMDKTSNDKTKSLPVTEPQLEMGLVNTEENTQAQCLMQGEQPSATTTPFNLKTKQLMSRLSMGIFKAKLPQKSKPDNSKKGNSVDKGQSTVPVNVSHQLSNFDHDMSDIYNEELGSYEGMSETLDITSPQKATEKVKASQEFNMDELLEEDVYEKDLISAASGKKRPLPADNVEDEKRLKVSTVATSDVEMGFPSHVVECDSNVTTVPSMTTQTTDYSNSSHTASIRCEATFESTYKQSLFESQLEDYANDVQRKLSDGTITLLEFFQLFNIDFVIHNPRQSILPGRLLSDTDRTSMDLLKDRHINLPKQMVYETDVLNLTEMVEGLKEPMRDLDKPLKIVNRPLWEEVRHFSDKEVKSFGAKLKERHNRFRKLSKVQSHEMKEVLYSNLLQANLKEQQKARGMIEEADGMIKSLDDCIRELETELIAVEEKGFEDQPSLKSRQEEMQKVTEALEDNNRQTSELEMQKQRTSDKLNRLKVETSNLETHLTALHMINEWKFGEKKDNCSVYTFLYETLILQLVYEKSNGNDADIQCERKISYITLSLQLDDEKTEGNARLVHRLLSQYIEGHTDWVEKYPTSRHVPKLLHDVSLVVSRCRQLGEELRRLKTWGSVRLNILNMSCVDTQVHIVFSSLKTLSEFEVIFSVSLIDQPYVLQLKSFNNMIGNTTIQQIEEIASSFSPSKNLLTKIVKKINENLLY
ncbi:uncharacterized protein knl1 [Etheostoma spectabile]|uniref:uncharacterized protein knl1 n=1 Tax=Etheostoma spectabile TaxID=54343 RepID=UPI0013AF6FD1|nr:kinetochore scaffold 1 [Etheostoma spectabile]XP_032399621.1 kinetochore scaffold 1 [Etheostoma spectabile]